jgi:hypothetical protein
VTDGVLLAWFRRQIVLTAAGVFVTPATDDRDPSIVLAGCSSSSSRRSSDWRRTSSSVATSRAWALDNAAAQVGGRHGGRASGAGRQRCHCFAEAAVEQLQGSPAGRVATIVMTEGGTGPAADDVCLYFAGADKFRICWLILPGPPATST